MKNFLKLATKYWLYNQLFFVLGAIFIALGIIFILGLPHNFYNYITAAFGNDAGFYLSVILFYTFLSLALFALYKFFKYYWCKTLLNYEGNLSYLSAAGILPMLSSAAVFTLCFYFTKASVESLIGCIAAARITAPFCYNLLYYFNQPSGLLSCYILRFQFHSACLFCALYSCVARH